MLYCDEICSPCRIGQQFYDPESVLYDTGLLLSTGLDREGAKVYMENDGASRWITADSADLRAILVNGADGEQYLLGANVGNIVSELTLPGPCVELHSEKRLTDRMEVAPLSARLCRLE